jgi:hypothetical protein
MTRYDAAPALADLKDFQRATVEHVTERFYGPAATDRFLVADETGLGKSLVARGVIARTLEHLQDDDGVQRVESSTSARTRTSPRRTSAGCASRRVSPSGCPPGSPCWASTAPIWPGWRMQAVSR